MTKNAFKSPKVFITTKRKTHITVTALSGKQYTPWLKKQSTAVKALAKEQGFKPGGASILILRNDKGAVKEIIAGIHDDIQLYDMSKVSDAITKAFSQDFLKTTSFEIKGLKGAALNTASLGWALTAYQFDIYTPKTSKTFPALLWSKGVDKKRVNAFADSMALLRNMINTPANDMGPDELESCTRKVSTAAKAKIKVIKGKALETGFPMVHAVGDSSPRAPRLLDMTWGKASHPKVTIIGKGVCFDTGGLDLKPSAYMKLMKKDMGGAAHALALAKMVMTLKLPVRLRLLIPAVENSVSGKAFRPGDVFTSRKGITVENTNTDAEGRLILSDAITLASEEKPDLIIDFATLTGSARAALGPDIPAMFSTNDKIAADLQKTSYKAEDPLWAMPLWQNYRKHIKSSVAELHNSAGLPGDLIYSALFLESFLVGKQNWVHIDTFAWESAGKPGRPKGAADAGMRAVFAFLEERYSK